LSPNDWNKLHHYTELEPANHKYNYQKLTTAPRCANCQRAAVNKRAQSQILKKYPQNQNGAQEVRTG